MLSWMTMFFVAFLGLLGGVRVVIGTSIEVTQLAKTWVVCGCSYHHVSLLVLVA